MVFTRQAQVPGRTDFRPVAATAALPPLKSVRLLDQVRERIRLLHYSLRTEEAYVYWARAFIRFHGLRHPAEMGKAEVEGFLMHLAAQKGLSASTHRQALSALIFLYDKVLGLQLPWLAEIGRPVPVRRLPVVLSRDEVTAVRGVSAGPAIDRSAQWRGAPAPPVRRDLSAGLQAGGAVDQGDQAGHASHLAALLCHAPAASRQRHPHGARVARPRRRGHHHDLHACVEGGWHGRAQPAGCSTARSMFTHGGSVMEGRCLLRRQRPAAAQDDGGPSRAYISCRSLVVALRRRCLPQVNHGLRIATNPATRRELVCRFLS